MRQSGQSRRLLIGAAIGGGLLIALIFFWIGYAARPPPDTSGLQALADRYRALGRRERGFTGQSVRAAVRRDEIGRHLSSLASRPHIAGTPGHRATAEYFRDVLSGLPGFEVFTRNYSVPVGMTVGQGESLFTIVYSNGTVVESQRQEKELVKLNLTDQVPPILSFTPSGNVSGPVVFANYGRERDFEYLQQLNVTLSGAIALMRYGGVGRGKKLVNAAAYGCTGGIVYSDPADGWAVPGRLDDVYPNSWWLPPTGVQRGSAKMRQADPQTPAYPSLPFAYRDEFDEIKQQTDPPVFSPIPGYPVGYGDAMKLLGVLEGANISSYVKGGLPIDYRAGGSFAPGVDHARLVVNNRILEGVNAVNVFAEMKGDLEPDRYVLLGNHRDAWGAGAVDATSGSAVLLEIARMLGQFYSDGWRPRRSILLCSWDVEEQGITGSWEWVEDRLPQIREKVVAYINIDIAVRGNYSIRTNADPLLQEAALQALKNLPAQDGGTMFEEFKRRWLDQDYRLSVPIGSSDYSAFIQTAAVPIIDASYVADPKYSSYYPLYHSMYETLPVMESIIDPGLRAHGEVAIWGVEMLRLLSETWLLPYDEAALIANIRNRFNSATPPSQWGWPASAAKYDKYVNDTWKEFDSALTALEAESARLGSAVQQLQERIDAGSEDIDPMSVRGFNDRRMRVMQTLADPGALLRDKTLRNLVFSSQTEETEISAGFPGLQDLLAVAKKRSNETEIWKQIAQHVSALVFRMHSLRYQLQDSGL
ncbi:hypothetical protein BOX15_Mlig018580g1 [Macrostomum lignano]|uniref:Peptidase M28 domain-containing protein n=1 Tax=Macrostomum lignano TaxID=282301 RepID=A0A267FM77_9PLAT|nr:hypothetical protein BOX15_Mlig018580g1 [Macrostomum lignano]